MYQQAANTQQANQVQTEHGSAATAADPQEQQQQQNNINGSNINGHIGVPPPDAAMGVGMHGEVAVPMSPLGVMATSIATPTAPTTPSPSRPGTRSSRYSPMGEPPPAAVRRVALDPADMEFLVRDLQNQNTEKEKRMVQLAATLDALSQKTAAAELRAVEYAKTRIEALEKDFIQSRLADRVANLEATSGPSLSLRVSELESALQFTGALVCGIPGDGRSIKAAFQMVEAELDTVKGQSVHKDELSKQLASAEARPSSSSARAPRSFVETPARHSWTSTSAPRPPRRRSWRSPPRSRTWSWRPATAAGTSRPPSRSSPTRRRRQEREVRRASAPASPRTSTRQIIKAHVVGLRVGRSPVLMSQAYLGILEEVSRATSRAAALPSQEPKSTASRVSVRTSPS